MNVISEASCKAGLRELEGSWGTELAVAVRLVIAAAAVLIFTVPPLQAQTEKVLYPFTGAVSSGPDGANPGAPLIRDAKGNLYGTTEFGGTSGDGTVFELVYSNGSYTEKVLHSFADSAAHDGALPYAGVVMDSSGNLYGTTNVGGASNKGTVFELVYSNGTYTEKVLYSFLGEPDGELPYGSLVMDSSGNLFGTTNLGGTAGEGAVFEMVNSSGSYTEKVLYSFKTSTDPPTDGLFPYAGLTIDSSGNLYGTTSGGGGIVAGVPFSCPNPSGCGTVFELVNSSGSYTMNMLYSFKGGATDGQTPIAGVIIDSSGNLYGTTSVGGASKEGTAFELVYSSATGSYTENVLHTFTGLSGGDGGTPLGLVLDSSGNLFGVTEVGGATNTSNTCASGCGTIFELVYSPPSPPSTSGSYAETVLYSFPTFSGDGLGPNAALVIDSSNNLYGVASSGGYTTPSGGGVLTACPFGCGIVFEYTPSPGAFAQYSTIGPINFGAVPVNTSGSQQLTLTNTGGASFMVNAVSLQGSDAANFTITSVVCNGTTIAPANYSSLGVTLNPNGKDACTFTVQFLPTLDQNGYAEDLVVATTATSSNASAGPGGTGQAFLLVGDGVAPFASYSPSQLSFGNVAPNTPATQTVTVTDTGAGPLIFQAVKISLGTGFSYTQVVCNNVTEPVPLPSPFTISAETSCIFTVQFDPSTSAAASGALGFEDNAGVGESNLTSINVNGTSFQQEVALSGNNLPSVATTTTVTSTSSSFMGLALPAGYALVGNPVTVNFTVQPVSGSLTATGTVIVEDGFHEYCNPVGMLTSANKGLGSCTLVFNGVGTGSTPISAQYTPDTASSSAGLLGSATIQPLFTENLVQIVNCGPLPPAQSATQGTTTTYSFTVCLAGDVGGAVTALVNSGCPQGATCDATVAAVPSQPGVYTVVVTIILGKSGGAVPLQDPGPRGGPWLLMLSCFALFLAFVMAIQLARQNRARPRLLYATGFTIALVLFLSGMNGCTSASVPNGKTGTPPNTYIIKAKVTAGNFSVNMPLTLTVTK